MNSTERQHFSGLGFGVSGVEKFIRRFTGATLVVARNLIRNMSTHIAAGETVPCPLSAIR
jgi:hypothetical protein